MYFYLNNIFLINYTFYENYNQIPNNLPFKSGIIINKQKKDI